MVQLSSTWLVFASLIVTGFASPAAKRTVAQIEADISTISSQVAALDNDINAFPASGGTVTQAFQIHTDATTLGSSLDNGTADVNAVGTFSETDGQTIFDSVKAFEPSILDALTVLVSRKSAFENLPVSGVVGVVLQDLINLNASTSAFEEALIAAAPADQQSQATTLKSDVDAAFASAIAAYSS